MTMRPATYHAVSRKLVAQSRRRFTVREALAVLHRGSRRPCP